MAFITQTALTLTVDLQFFKDNGDIYDTDTRPSLLAAQRFHFSIMAKSVSSRRATHRKQTSYLKQLVMDCVFERAHLS